MYCIALISFANGNTICTLLTLFWAKVCSVRKLLCSISYIFPTLRYYLFLHTQKRPRQLLAREEFCTKKILFFMLPWRQSLFVVIQENVTKFQQQSSGSCCNSSWQQQRKKQTSIGSKCHPLVQNWIHSTTSYFQPKKKKKKKQNVVSSGVLLENWSFQK